MSTQTQLKISIPELNTRLIKIVRAFISKRYSLVKIDEAEICIIDFDAYQTSTMIDGIRQDYPDLVIIALALKDPELEKVIYLQKPFKQEDLMKSLELAQTPVNTPNIVAPKKQISSIHQAANAVSNRLVNERQVARTGVSNRGQSPHYNPEEYLQGALKTAYNKSKTVGFNLRLDAWWQPIIIFPRTNKVFVEADDKKLQAFCRLPLKTFAQHQSKETEHSDEFKISPEPMFNTNKLNGSLQSMDAFLWKVAWWNAGGHLPIDIKERQPITLKSWPNITRFLCPDHAVQICALLFHKPVSPLRIAELLNLERKEVYGFISAAHALGLIETPKINSVAPVKQQPSSAPTPTSQANSGFLRRILSHIKR